MRRVSDAGWQREAHASLPAAARSVPAQTEDCCNSLAELPFQPLDSAGTRSVQIDAHAPLHAFASGTSRFAAFRIDALPRPARIEVSSLRSAETGSWFQATFPAARQAVLQPTVLILDRAFQVVRRIDALEARSGCSADAGEAAFRLPVVIDEPPLAAAYLVVVSSAESLAREGTKVCGMVRHGMSPVGSLELRTRILPSDDRPLRMVLPVTWYSGARSSADTGFWQTLAAEPGLVVLGGQRLRMLLPDGLGWHPVLDLPYASLARAGGGTPTGDNARSFYVTALETDAGGRAVLQDHLFDVGYAAGDGVPPLESVVAQLRAQIAALSVRQTVAWQVRSDAPVTAIQGGRLARLGDAAASAGMLTAMPCGVCQGGGCPPAALGACASLFGVGAVLGGTAGLVREVVGGPPPGDAARRRMQAQVAAGPPLAPAHLELCLRGEFAQPGRALWTDAGLSAQSELIGATALADGPGDPDYRAEVRLRELLMEPAERPAGGGEAQWRLHLKTDLTLVSAVSGRRSTSRLEWLGQPYPESAWTRADSPVLPEVTAEACTALAARLVDAGERAWRGH